MAKIADEIAEASFRTLSWSCPFRRASSPLSISFALSSWTSTGSRSAARAACNCRSRPTTRCCSPTDATAISRAFADSQHSTSSLANASRRPAGNASSALHGESTASSNLCSLAAFSIVHVAIACPISSAPRQFVAAKHIGTQSRREVAIALALRHAARPVAIAAIPLTSATLTTTSSFFGPGQRSGTPCKPPRSLRLVARTVQRASVHTKPDDHAKYFSTGATSSRGPKF